MTNKELNAAVKTELKANGYNVKDFGVSVKDCGYSTSIKVTIKNPHVKRSNVETLLKSFSECERDERTQEILEGGNTYLFVDYQYGIFEEVKTDWITTATGVFREQGETIRIFDGLLFLNISGRFEVRQHTSEYWGTKLIYSVDELAELLYKFSEFNSIAA